MRTPHDGVRRSRLRARVRRRVRGVLRRACCSVPADTGEHDGRVGCGNPRNVLHRVDESVQTRWASTRRAGLDSRRIERHRHNGHSVGACIGVDRFCDSRVGRKVRGLPSSWSRCRRQLSKPGFRRGRPSRNIGSRSGRHPDIMGGDYFVRNLDCLALGGRLVQIGLLGGSLRASRSRAHHAPAADGHRIDVAGSDGRRKG